MKKKNKKVVSRDSLPSRSPLEFLAVIYLLMDKFGAPDIYVGVFACMAVLITVGWVSAVWNETEINLPTFGSPEGN